LILDGFTMVSLQENLLNFSLLVLFEPFLVSEIRFETISVVESVNIDPLDSSEWG